MKVVDLLAEYEKLMERAVEISKIPGLYFETDHFCVRAAVESTRDAFGNVREAIDSKQVVIQVFEAKQGYYDDPASIGYFDKLVPVELFEMSDERLAAYKQKLIDDRETVRQKIEHEKAMKEVADRDAKERAEFERLSQRFGGAS